MSTYYIAGFPITDELRHYGIDGMHWGERRFQNPDGTYTEAGKERYRKSGAERRAEKAERNRQKRVQKYERSVAKGDELIGKGRTAGGAIARGVGRQLAIAAGTAAAGYLLQGAMIDYGVNNLFNDPQTSAMCLVGQEYAMGIAQTVGLGLTVGNVVKTYKQHRDIRRAENRLYEENRRKT